MVCKEEGEIFALIKFCTFLQKKENTKKFRIFSVKDFIEKLSPYVGLMYRNSFSRPNDCGFNSSFHHVLDETNLLRATESTT